MGLGRFGGGVGVTRWLAQQGAHVLVTDIDPAEKLRESIAQFQDLINGGQVHLRLGGHVTSDFAPPNCDLMIANPAVPKPWQNPFIRAAVESGVPVTTEIRLLVERLNRNRVIGITGSAGKSTTTAMVHHILVRSGCGAHLGGNIGGSLLNQLDAMHPDDWIVLELSSAMLYWLGERVGSEQSAGWSPHVGLITNIEPNHLDWHGSFEHYRDSKLNISRHMTGGDLLLNGDDLNVSSAQRLNLRVLGRHNQINAHMACRVVEEAIGLDPADAGGLLCDFPSLPHRLQFVGEHDGLRFYNDSKSTTPQATVLAVEAFEEPGAVHLIAGGYDKGSDLRPIADVSQRIAGLYTIGATGKTLAAASSGHVQYCETLAAAVETALARMKPGDSLLLSPGCASWDQFTNYEQRGEAFTNLINDLAPVT